MKTLIVYFSRTGSNKILAENISQKLKADLVEIQSQSSYQGPLGFIRGGFEGIAKKSVDIKPLGKDLSKYDLIVLLSPVWAGMIPPPVRTFLNKSKKDMQKLSFISISGQGSKNNKTIPEIKSIIGEKLAKHYMYSIKKLKNKDFKMKLDKFIQGLSQ